jgi:hypothetical protein
MFSSGLQIWRSSIGGVMDPSVWKKVIMLLVITAIAWAILILYLTRSSYTISEPPGIVRFIR